MVKKIKIFRCRFKSDHFFFMLFIEKISFIILEVVQKNKSIKRGNNMKRKLVTMCFISLTVIMLVIKALSKE